MFEDKHPRADFTYTPKVHDLKDAMYTGTDPELLDRILANVEANVRQEIKRVGLESDK